MDTSMTLTRGVWRHGTFGLTVEYMLEDILEDGEPVPDVTVHYEDESGTPALYSGRVAEVRGGDVVFTDGHAVHSVDITRIAVA